MVDQTVFNLVPDNNEEEFVVDFGEVTQVETTTDFNNLENRPKYNDELMTGETNIPAVPTKVSDLENDSDYQTDTQVAAAVEVETTARQNADINLQGQIDAITSASDVVDIVGTYAELQAYPTAQLKDNDVIKVIQDNTHNDAMTYYRWSTSTSTWTYIGSEGPYYTKSQADNLLLEKQDKLTAGENITITNNVISATGGGGSYTAGNAIDITGNVISADIYPADYFTAGATTTGTGANITLNNTIPAKLEDVKLYGDTTQNGTPTPDFPQDIHVVTGTQTVAVTGKNLLKLDNNNVSPSNSARQGATITINDNSIRFVATGTNSTQYAYCFTGELNPNKQYVLSGAVTKVAQTSIARVNYSYSDDGTTWAVNATAFEQIPMSAGTTATFSQTLSGHKYYRFGVYNSFDATVIGTETYYYDIQIEEGSTATDYEPYQSQSHTVDLGSTELCKLGDYQDYIYKSGDDWYVHKAIGKTILSSTSNWMVRTDASVTDCTVFRDYDYVAGLFDNNAQGLSTHFRVTSSYSANVIRFVNNNSYGITPVLENDTLGIVSGDDNTQKATKFKTWLSNNTVSVYYALATPTDTKITDAGLIADLDALGGATTYLDTTSFAVTATGTNLPALLNPTAYRNSADGVASRITDAPTYSDFVGTDGNTGGTHGLVPAPATTDAGKFLKADGTWDTAGGGGPTVVQATGTSTTDVMSQNAVSSTIFADPGTNEKVQIGSGANVSAQSNNMAIGYNASANGTQAIAIGSSAKARPSGTALGNSAQAGNGVSHGSCVAIGNSAYVGGTNGTAVGASSNIINSYATAIGSNARARSERSLAIGASAQVDNSPAMDYSVALGASATTTRAGEVNVGTGSQNYGYNSTPYRVIGGVHDGQDAHDAVTVGQINATIDALNTALGSSIPHIGA